MVKEDWYILGQSLKKTRLYEMKEALSTNLTGFEYKCA